MYGQPMFVYYLSESDWNLYDTDRRVFSFQGVNLDLIQFNEVVVVQEMRIIPLGAKVEINACGARLGATNPNVFHIEAYVNNRNTKDPPTFLKVGR